MPTSVDRCRFRWESEIFSRPVILSRPTALLYYCRVEDRGFEPEHAGKLNFYIRAVDEQLRNEEDQPTVELLLCKSRDRLVAEYALSDIHKPIGVSEYQITQRLPEALKSSLPTVEELEAELGGEVGDEWDWVVGGGVMIAAMCPKRT